MKTDPGAATTASALDVAFAPLKSVRHQPAIRTVPPCFAHPAYISTLAVSVRDHLAAREWRPEVVLTSFHSLPLTMITSDDPYLAQCRTSFRLLGTALGLPEAKYIQAFPSNTGRASWLTPRTEDKNRDLSMGGTRNLLVIPPGFATDCLETLEELGIRAGRVFSASTAAIGFRSSPA